MIIDIVCGVIVLAAIIWGHFRGAFSQFTSLLAIILVYYLTYPLTTIACIQLNVTTFSGAVFVLIGAAIVVYLAIKMVGALLDFLIVRRLFTISPANNMIGALLGLVKGAVTAILFVITLNFLTGLRPPLAHMVNYELNRSKVFSIVQNSPIPLKIESISDSLHLISMLANDHIDYDRLKSLAADGRLETILENAFFQKIAQKLDISLTNSPQLREMLESMPDEVDKLLESTKIK